MHVYRPVAVGHDGKAGGVPQPRLLVDRTNEGAGHLQHVVPVLIARLSNTGAAIDQQQEVNFTAA